MSETDGTDPRKVAARLMGLWENDPFTNVVDIERDLPHCPFRENYSCTAAKKRGVRKEWVMLPCPLKGRRGSVFNGAPPECPLRYGEIVVRRKQ